MCFRVDSNILLRQDIAVTGSVNQWGEVQAIGGVNEKIEGFYDVCRVLGLTGEQGVLIPESNIRHPILRRDVIQAVAEAKFQCSKLSPSPRKCRWKAIDDCNGRHKTDKKQRSYD